MKVLVIGSGAREHAIISALLADDTVTEVASAPGNAGIAADARCIETDSSVEHLVEVAVAESCDLVVVGPERLPKLALAAPPHYKDSYHFHGLEELRVKF